MTLEKKKKGKRAKKGGGGESGGEKLRREFGGLRITEPRKVTPKGNPELKLPSEEGDS